MRSHCWHLTSPQHSMVGHRCVQCCFCGESKCQSSETATMPSHGRYAPKVDVWSGSEETGCPERKA